MQIRSHSRRSLRQIEQLARELTGQIYKLESEVQEFINAQPTVWAHYPPGVDWVDFMEALVTWSNDVAQVPEFPLLDED
jgi:hypothetical protein